MTPDFTVVTASYNYGRFIGDCLGSVAGQGGVTVEHLVFDGGSTDATAEVLSRFPAVSAVTAFRTGHGLVPELLGWQQHAHFGLLILRDMILVWSAEQQAETMLHGSEAVELLASLLPNIQGQLDALEADHES